jgi:hypothetical protein
MVTRKQLTAMTVGLSVGLLAQHATGAEPPAAPKAPPAQEFLIVDVEVFRNDIDAYVRELNRQMRETLNEQLRRELAPKLAVMASNELRQTS